jgi:hypothetical protein
MKSPKRWLVPCLALGLLTGGAASAQAAQSVYPPDASARTLDAGPAGYTSGTSSDGLCVPALLCPVVSNKYKASGGVNNSGHIETSLGSLLGVGATSTGTFESPAFTYRGVEGEDADSASLKIARRSDVAALLQVTGNSATYSVDLVDLSGGSNVSVIDGRTLEGISTFAEKSVSVDPSSLEVGHRYSIRITSRFESGAQVLPGGSVGYDNVSLQAKTESNGSTGSNGSNGSNGPKGGNGSSGNGGGNGSDADKQNGNGIVGKSVLLQGNRLIVRVRCSKNPRARCKLNLQGKLRKKGPAATSRRTARVRSGAKRKVALNVKNGYLSKIAARKRVVIKQRVRKGGESVTAYRKVRVKLG